MKKCLFLGLSLVFAFLGTQAYSQSKKIKWLDGVWVGVGYQPPTKSNWQIKLEVNASENSILIDYPDLECSGKWEIKSLKKNKKSEFEEIILEGLNVCDNHVKVIIQPIDEHYLSVSYFLPSYDGVAAFSVLRKQVTEK